MRQFIMDFICITAILLIATACVSLIIMGVFKVVDAVSSKNFLAALLYAAMVPFGMTLIFRFMKRDV